jgi:Glycosyl transferase family 2
MLKKYYYKLLGHYLSLYIRPENSVAEINPSSDLLIKRFSKGSFYLSPSDIVTSKDAFTVTRIADLKSFGPDYILLNGNIHFEKDIEDFFDNLHADCKESTRIIIIYFNSLWKPFTKLASFLKLRTKTPEQNWISHADVGNFMRLSNFEIIRRDNKILVPVWLPVISYLFNRYFAPLPFFRLFSLVNIVVAKPVFNANEYISAKSVSIVIPARNESGNIENIIRSIPKMGPDDEIIFIEGHSTDDTWEKIQEIQKKYLPDKKILISQQNGKGKGDAVRKGFSMASKEILMILDADLTVPAADLTKFYKAMITGKGEFITGSRLVYPMEKKAMRFFNILGNKFFATGFSFILGQKIKDTLCGTKVITKENYLKIEKYRNYFGEFDPFGDFDLILGSSRLGLKIIEIPIAYRERIYGTTNIQRWKHGVILIFAAQKIKFI